MSDRREDEMDWRENPVRLRERAERVLAARQHGAPRAPAEQLEQLVHELEVHRVELEMQNEELRRARAELEYSRNRYADLYDFAPVGYLTLDDAGIIRELNLTAAEMLGVERCRVLGHPLLMYAEFGGKNRVVDHLRRCREAEEGAELVAEIRLRCHPEGSLPVQLRSLAVWAPDQHKRQYRTVLVDLSELRRSEEALQASEQMLALAVEAAEAGTWEIDLDTNELFASERALMMQSLPGSAKLTLESALARVHAEDRPRVAAALRRAIEHDEDYRVEFRVAMPDRSIRWLTSQGKRRQTRHGRRLLGLMQDVTQRKQAETELKALNQQLEQRVAERTAEARRRAEQLRRLANELSDAERRERRRLAKLLHDHLQQLLVAACMRLSTVKLTAGPQLTPELDELNRLLSDCIACSRDLTIELSPPILQRGKLSEALAWLIGWLHQHHGLHVELDVQSEPARLPEPIRDFLFQAVREMLFNVVKHAEGRSARVALVHADQKLTVEIEDAGHSFDPQRIQRKLDAAENFGLFHIRERLNILGGSMEFARSPSGGGCFRLIFPQSTFPSPPIALPPPAPDGSGRPVQAARPGNGTLRLLVVDDHKIVREGFVILLDRQSDFKIVGEASDGEEAVQQAQALRPDVVIMDVNMPVLDGVEATRRIAQLNPDIRIIGLSLDQEEAVAREMVDAGAVAYVCKDAPPEKLFAAIRQAVRR